ncbi:uncharacterized protein FOMMEDRAFT_141091 [Fomitiporia mediterranea MF3/22]|uniref:uncharacterized protein n=1 Tax=Fomitiporia mediterranea (strain MF3/22) TaxID=694068 RepID=UPI0004407EB9|nr:uncharacterized protein FOMMEDRAFT_141091 [Fomitiporia mediterranea MF3/22]EJD01843.1 hypothetical protein FOMMEDRAFT_141091 [Fomitiporia mediterranea MF3/22]
MYRHPFANPEHLYERAITPDVYADRRSQATGLGPYTYRSFMPMASQSSFFSDRPKHPFADVERGRGRAASLPDVRRPVNRYEPMTWLEEFDETQSEPGGRRRAWRRVIRRMTRRARRGLEKVRALLYRDDRRSISGFR